MHFWSTHLFFYKIFSYSHDSKCFRPHRGALTIKKREPLWEPVHRIGPPNIPKKAPFRSTKWAPKGSIPSFGGGAKGHPVVRSVPNPLCNDFVKYALFLRQFSHQTFQCSYTVTLVTLYSRLTNFVTLINLLFTFNISTFSHLLS